MAKILHHPLLSLFVLLVWLLLANSLGAGAFLVGAILAVLVPLITKRFWADHPHLYRPAVLLRLVPLVLADIVTANIAVAWITLTRSNRSLRPTFLRIPLQIHDPHGTVMLASIITLTPGTVSAQFSADRRTLYVHMLDCDDEAEAIEQIRTRYERPLKELLEC
ncbi:Na+/H+ antiporter subunit E [Arhodomonas sp. AD133]|uniref:Na+/H+ antiporter subunit E n=1 Tax=Arhodomonas sp. AD133 TaxID=3415009 RepID=UPI003EB6EF7E